MDPIMYRGSNRKWGSKNSFPHFFRHISASGFGSGGLATRFLAGLATVALPYGLSVDIEPFRTPPTGEKYYFRLRLLPIGFREAAKRVFFGRFGRRGLALGDI